MITLAPSSLVVVLFSCKLSCCFLELNLTRHPSSAILFAALSTMAEIPALFGQRPIVLRQSRAAMYHPFIESLATTLVDVPKMFAILIFFAIVLYFLVGLNQAAGPFL